MPLEFLHLRTLVLQCPLISNLENFPRLLPSLKKLAIKGCDLHFSKPLSCEAPNLENIDVSHCKFRDFTFLRPLSEMFQKNLLWRKNDTLSAYEKAQGFVHYNFIHLPVLRSFDGLPSIRQFASFRSFDGLLRLSIFQLISSLISARLDYKYDDGIDKNFKTFKTHKDQFPPFFRAWAEQWNEIKAREFDYETWTGFPIEVLENLANLSIILHEGEPDRQLIHSRVSEEEKDKYIQYLAEYENYVAQFGSDRFYWAPCMEDAEGIFEDQKTTDLLAHIDLLLTHYRRALPQLLDAVLHADPLNNWPSDFTPELIERVIHECTPKELHNVLEFLPSGHPLHALWHTIATTRLPGSNSKWNIVL